LARSGLAGAVDHLAAIHTTILARQLHRSLTCHYFALP